MINQTAAICNQRRSGPTEEYYVLLILTDGVITDMDNTIRAIVDSSRLPLSIIIVGVGQANFDNMNILDADETPLRSNGVTMARDIVQFVPFRDFQAGTFGGEALAEAVLAEVPDQFVSYMTQHSVKPRPPPRVDTLQAMTNGAISPVASNTHVSSVPTYGFGGMPGPSSPPAAYGHPYGQSMPAAPLVYGQSMPGSPVAYQPMASTIQYSHSISRAPQSFQ